MADNNWIQELVTRVVSQALEQQFPALRDELVRRVLQELQPNLGSSDSNPKQLLQAISGVRQASGQKDILSALLDGASHFSSRTALFVVRGSAVSGWQARGFAKSDEIKNCSLDVSTGLGQRVLEEKTPVKGTAGDLDANFTATFAAPQDGRVLLLPLLLKERVAAVLYADAGTEDGGQLDDAALEMLVLSSGLWLEIVALRRATATPEPAEPAAAAPAESSEAMPAAPAESSEAMPAAPAETSEPVAAEAASSAVAAMATPEAVAEPAAEAAPMAMAAVAAAGSAGTAASVPARGDDEAIHRKARRFAKLLVDEIKLYNKPKLDEGKKNRDLYERLREDIEKSRAAYEKRYGGSAAGGASYFDQEIVQNLADNDPSLLGAGFSR